MNNIFLQSGPITISGEPSLSKKYCNVLPFLFFVITEELLFIIGFSLTIKEFI